MTILNLFTGIVNVLAHPRNVNNDVLIWAKTEYGKDWQFAYSQIMEYGIPPKTNTKGITL